METTLAFQKSFKPVPIVFLMDALKYIKNSHPSNDLCNDLINIF